MRGGNIDQEICRETETENDQGIGVEGAIQKNPQESERGDTGTEAAIETKTKIKTETRTEKEKPGKEKRDTERGKKEKKKGQTDIAALATNEVSILIETQRRRNALVLTEEMILERTW